MSAAKVRLFSNGAASSGRPPRRRCRPASQSGRPGTSEAYLQQLRAEIERNVTTLVDQLQGQRQFDFVEQFFLFMVPGLAPFNWAHWIARGRPSYSIFTDSMAFPPLPGDQDVAPYWRRADGRTPVRTARPDSPPKPGSDAE